MVAMASEGSPPEFDVEFKAQLERRILSYSVQEDRLRKQLRELHDELDAVRRRRRSAEQLFTAEFGRVPEDVKVIDVEDDESEERSSWTPGPLTGLSWSDAMMRVLEQEPDGLHAREIWRRLATNGFRSDAVDPVRSVVAIAVRDPAIVKVRPNTYALNGKYLINGTPPSEDSDVREVTEQADGSPQPPDS